MLTALLQQHIVAVFLVAQADPNVTEIAKKLELFDLTKITLAITIIAVSFFTNRLVVSVLDRLGEGQARRRLLFKKIQSFTKLGIFIVAAYLVVMVFFGGDGDNKALLGLGGTLAVAVGFALKDTTSSLMAGVLILIDQPFQVGDRVQFGSTYGEVKEIGLRSVRIVTLDDNEVSIPNNKFLTEAVASANSGALDMMVVIKFHIAMTEDFELAKKLVYEACITSKYVFLDKPVTILLKDEVTGIAFSTVITCKAYVIDTRYEMAFVSDVTERAKRAFKQHLIHPPYNREYSVRSTEWDDFEASQSEKRANEILSDEDQVGTNEWLKQSKEVEEVILDEAPQQHSLVNLAVEMVHAVGEEEELIASAAEDELHMDESLQEPSASLATVSEADGGAPANVLANVPVGDGSHESDQDAVIETARDTANATRLLPPPDAVLEAQNDHSAAESAPIVEDNADADLHVAVDDASSEGTGEMTDEPDETSETNKREEDEA